MDELVERYRAAQEAIGGGCSDGYCVVKRPHGQHTNGGCRCMYRPDHITCQRAGHIMRLAQEMADAIEALQAQLAEARRAALEEAAKVADAQEAKAQTRYDADDEDETDWDGGVVFGTKIGARIIAAAIRALAEKE